MPTDLPQFAIDEIGKVNSYWSRKCRALGEELDQLNEHLLAARAANDFLFSKARLYLINPVTDPAHRQEEMARLYTGRLGSEVDRLTTDYMVAKVTDILNQSRNKL